MLRGSVLGWFLPLLLGVCVHSAMAAPKTLTLWIVGIDKGITSGIVPEFKKAYGIDVKVESVNWGDIQTKLSLQTVAGIAPDVIMTGHGYALALGSMNLGTPLDPYIKTWNDRNQIPDNLWETCRWKGKTYVIPWQLDFRPVMYNRQLFTDRGLDPEHPPATWNDMLTAAKKLTITDGRMLKQVGGDFGVTWGTFSWFLAQKGGRMVDSDLRKAAFNTPNGLEAVKFLQALHNVNYPANTTGLRDWHVTLYMNGKMAFTVGYSPIGCQLNPKLKDKTSVFTPRFNSGTKPVASTYVNGLAIPKGSKNKDLAWKLVSYIVGETGAKVHMTHGAGAMYARTDIARQASKLQPYLLKWYDEFQYAVSDWPTLPTSRMESSLDAVLSKVQDNAATPEHALATAEKDWNTILNDWHKRIDNR